jgi:hypothetical protein
MELTRKEFLVLLVGSAAAACGGSSDSASGNCAANGTAVSIAQNTGHALVISKADITAGVDKTYDIQGIDSSHTHKVTITAADFAALQKNMRALETSTAGNAAGQAPHTHQITVSCA